MPSNNGISRREFLRASMSGAVGLVGVSVLSACAGPQAPPTAPATAATAKPAAAAGAATPAAKAADTKADTKIGQHLIGKLEGPEVMTDAAKLPKKFGEAPMLADLVKSGKLPPVEKRLPEEPLVLKPLQQVGKYGGTWRRGFTGPADGENGNRISASDKPLFWDYMGTKVMPGVAKAWKVEDEGRKITITLRKGMRWSDGEPFTANDFVFWFEDIYKNKELVPTPSAEMSINGKPGTLEKVDDYTVVYKFADPYYLFVEVYAGDGPIGRGQAAGTGQQGGACQGGYAPAHYLKQFHPKYVSKEELDKKVAEAKMDNWVRFFISKTDWTRNPDLPVLAPWKTVTPINTPRWTLERNPYYYEVDTEGNQLPYIDRIAMTLAENLEVLNLRAIAGEYDFQERHTDLGKLPVLLENQAKGDYKVFLDPRPLGSDTNLHINQSYEADPEVAKWFQNRDFRRALSLGIDRDQLNEVFWLGLGTTGSIAPEENLPHSPGPEYRKLWSTFDPKKANELLDKAGLDKKDGDGYRLRTDGKGRLRIEIMTVAAQFIPYTQHAEMIKEQWKKIGIEADVKELERNLAYTRVNANEHQIMVWSIAGAEHMLLFPDNFLPVVGNNCIAGPLYGKWYASGGSQGKKPTDPQTLKIMELFRSAPGLKPEEGVKAVQEIWKILVEEQWNIGTVGLSPASMGVRVVKNNMGNIPAREANGQIARTPGSSHPETFFFKS